MLELWFQLFPSVSSRAPGDMRDRVSEIPELWTQLMRELYTDELDADTIWTPATTLSGAVKQSPEAAWCTAWSSGFVFNLEQLIQSRYLCGFTREQLVTAQDRRRVGRCALMLDLFVACAKRVLARQRQEEVAVMLKMLQDTVTEAFAKLWNIRDPFLIAQPTNPANSPNAVDYLYGLHVTIDTLGHLTTITLRKHRDIDFIASHIPHVCLMIWLHSPVTRNRAAALSTLELLHHPPESPPDHMWIEFFRSADLGYSGDEQIAHAVLRDLAEEKVVDDSLASVLILLGEWQLRYRDAPEKLPQEPRFAPYCMAAARRELCQGTSPEPTGFSAMAVGTFKILKMGSLTSSKQCYGFLDLFCRFLRLHMKLYDDAVPPLLDQYIDWGLAQLGELDKDIRPKASALRRHTLEEWQAVDDDIVRRQLARTNSEWRRFARTWKAVRRHLLPKPDETQEGAFGVLDHCAWDECLCSRHRPAHKMRMCKGCERVVYCGERCQRNDWELGEHRYRCTGRKVA
ncbi:zinc finger MYND domain-containing protein [Phanerochaete sordida]|uniref:Zinc finger MYND domain-containing protein n=1 Tax=Phanerochaete sordida TaxID=48140 RepID=A0A9P3GEK5_9APHY|nr:zinc finger MYND domain-containing protein [Phanerochaete sordida]